MQGSTLIEKGVEHAFCNATACGERYGFSSRHWKRLVDAGRAPQPIRFGRLLRWNLATLEQWESNGCPRISTTGVKE